jgi:3-methylfumaryl-CoA hydratase
MALFGPHNVGRRGCRRCEQAHKAGRFKHCDVTAPRAEWRRDKLWTVANYSFSIVVWGKMGHDFRPSESELATYGGHIGQLVEETDTISIDFVRRFAATLDSMTPSDGDPLPQLWHYGFFRPSVATRKLGEDGHPPRGDFMPVVQLPRRMFASAEVRFLKSITIGHEAKRTSKIISVEPRSGRSGTMLFVRISINITQAGMPSIEETQTIVYRNADVQTPTVIPTSLLPLPIDHVVEDWLPNRVELFRFSALMFNAHRIHYDLPYVREIEGYPDLVVHGPLTAIRLCALAQRVAGKPIKSFSFRGEAPLFVDQPVRLIAKAGAFNLQLSAERCDGQRAMSATAVV